MLPTDGGCVEKNGGSCREKVNDNLSPWLSNKMTCHHLPQKPWYIYCQVWELTFLQQVSRRRGDVMCQGASPCKRHWQSLETDLNNLHWWSWYFSSLAEIHQSLSSFFTFSLSGLHLLWFWIWLKKQSHTTGPSPPSSPSTYPYSIPAAYTYAYSASIL